MSYYMASGRSARLVHQERPGLGAEVIGGAAAGGVTGYTQAVPYIGTLTKAVTGGFKIAAAETSETKAAIAATTAAQIGLAFVPVIGPLLSVAAGILGSFITGKITPLTHEQRELKDVGEFRGPRTHQLIGEVLAAGSMQSLWDVLVSWSSGYVGGSRDQAIGVSVKDSGGAGVNLSVGYPGVYPASMFFPDAESFFKAVMAAPENLSVAFFAGISQEWLAQFSGAIRNAILHQVRRIAQLEVERWKEEIRTGVKGMEWGLATVNPQGIMEGLSKIPTSQPFEARAYQRQTALARVNGRMILAPPGVVSELVPGVKYVPPELHERIARGLIGWEAR